MRVAWPIGNGGKARLVTAQTPADNGESTPQEQGIVRSSNGQFVKGKSGNPGGRPKGKSITAELNKLIAKGDKAKELAEKAIALALAGDFRFFSLVADRHDGKVVDVLQTENLHVHVLYDQGEIPVDEDGALEFPLVE